MHQSLQGATFHVEHVFPSALGGLTVMENLAWACPGCNLKKSDRTQIIDPLTIENVRMFNPRRDNWYDHFAWDGFRIVALSPTGRALVEAFELNHLRRQRIRQAEQLFGLFHGNSSDSAADALLHEE